MHKDKNALVKTLRGYKKHILAPVFLEAADTIEELMETVQEQKAQIITMAADAEKKQDPLGFFAVRYQCSACGNWQTYGRTRHCPNCGKPMEVEIS